MMSIVITEKIRLYITPYAAGSCVFVGDFIGTWHATCYIEYRNVLESNFDKLRICRFRRAIGVGVTALSFHARRSVNGF